VNGWRGQAACSGMAPLFDLDSQLTPINDSGKGGFPIDQRDYHLSTLINICQSCPVLTSCRSDADRTLNFDTVRAGVVYGAQGQPIHIELTKRLTAAITEETRAA
jgi:hypothetical protein